MKNTAIQGLDRCEIGTRGIVVTIKGDKELQTRLLNMGLLAGSEVEVLQQGGENTPALIVVGETRLAIGREMSAQIMISPLAEKTSSTETSPFLKRCFGKTWRGGHHEKMFERFTRRKQGKNRRLRKGKFSLS